MRFSTAIAAQLPPQADSERARALLDAMEVAPRPSATAHAPWPADAPPDDLDQRVRLVGEWQLGEDD